MELPAINLPCFLPSPPSLLLHTFLLVIDVYGLALSLSFLVVVFFWRGGDGLNRSRGFFGDADLEHERSLGPIE